MEFSSEIYLGIVEHKEVGSASLQVQEKDQLGEVFVCGAIYGIKLHKLERTDTSQSNPTPPCVW